MGGLLVVLEVKTNTGKIDQRLDTNLAELLGVTDTRALKNEGRAESTARNDDLLAGLDDARHLLGWVERLGRDTLHTNGAVALEDDLEANQYAV